jgi:hypothetical protein
MRDSWRAGIINKDLRKNFNLVPGRYSKETLKSETLVGMIFGKHKPEAGLQW